MFVPVSEDALAELIVVTFVGHGMSGKIETSTTLSAATSPTSTFVCGE